MGTLDGKVALVTGSASGIGRATAEELARRGAAVVIADVDEKNADAVAAGITASGGRAAAVAVDVTVESQVEEMVAFAVRTFGGLDVLHNNAALMDRAVQTQDTDVVNISLEIWNRTLQVNLTGVMLGCKFGVPALLERGGGSIVNTTSGSGMRGDMVRVAYGASKAGVVAVTNYVAAAYGDRGIRCNAVSPGWIEKPTRVASIPAEAIAQIVDATPQRRAGSVEEVARVVAFLASDDASFVSGEVIRVDGGQFSALGSLAFTRSMRDQLGAPAPVAR